jgi:hypothetical protein
MPLFAHHAEGILEIEVFGKDIMPGTAFEHVVAGVIALAVAFFLLYGIWASVRDLYRWARRLATART